MRLTRPSPTRDPFTLLEHLWGEMDRTFGGRAPHRSASTARRTPLTVHETESAYTLRAPLPGVDRTSLSVTVEGATVGISGSRPEPDADAARRFSAERWTGPFSREIELPQAVDPEAVRATFDAGVLTVTLPKSAAAQPRHIPVSWS